MSEKKRLLLATSRVLILILLFFTVVSKARNNNHVCPQSSCGNITSIRFPFRLRGDPESCGFNHDFELECRNNQTLFYYAKPSEYYFVQEINYDDSSIRLVDPNIYRGNLSSCPLYSYHRPNSVWFGTHSEISVVFIQCLNPIISSKYVGGAPLCTGNTTKNINIFSNNSNNSSEIYSYVFKGPWEGPWASDVEESCAVSMVVQALDRGFMTNNSSWVSFHDALGYGFELGWAVYNTTKSCVHHVPLSEFGYDFAWRLEYKCNFEYWGPFVAIYGGLAAAAVLLLRFLIGIPLMVVLVFRKWRKCHLSMDETIEEFLQGHNNLTPIKYTYSEIKKMTNNFSQKLGEGGYGTVYKGQLRSSPFIAVKVMDQSVSSEQEFISEVGTIGLIHHVNIVKLIGFCVKGSKCALVYEYLPNGSLDRYLFSQQGIGALAMRYEKMYEIALGVAHGVDYLHRGCDMQILHFDIKPHNILLDDNFSPKISDFGLAKLYPSDGGSIINLTAARGTMGYMAPEMFYKNIGGVSYKADVYSFGMLLMEMVGRRNNMNPFAGDVGQIYFPSWAYDQLHDGKEIEISDASEEERNMVIRIIVVALWCIQMKPSDRPPMNKVVEMLEGNEELMLPPKPFVAPREIVEG